MRPGYNRPQPIEDLKDIFHRLCGNTHPRMMLGTHARESWQGKMPVAPEEFAKVATDGLGIGRMHIFEIGYHFYVRVAGLGIRDEYPLIQHQGRVGDGAIVSRRHDGISGRRALGLRFAGAAMLGLDRGTIHPSSYMGAYVWARTGVEPTPETAHWLTKKINARLEIIRDAIDPGIAGFVREHAALEAPGDLKAIADLKTPVTDKAYTRFEKALTATDAAYVAWNYKQQKFIGREIGIGKFLLAGLSYRADIFFSDKPLMDMIERNTGVPVRAIAAAHGIDTAGWRPPQPGSPYGKAMF